MSGLVVQDLSQLALGHLTRRAELRHLGVLAVEEPVEAQPIESIMDPQG